MSGSLIAVMTCGCGRSVSVPMTLGPGNDPHFDEPEGWSWAFDNDDNPIIQCPQCDVSAGGTCETAGGS